MNKKHTILLIEKDDKLADVINRALSESELRVERAISGYEAFQMLKLYKFDIIILEQDIPLINLSEAIRIIQRSNKNIPIIILLDKNKNKRENLLHIIKGNFDCLIKPIDIEVLKEKVDDILYSIETQKEIQKIREKLKVNFGFNEIIGKCDKMFEVFKTMKNVADSNVTVFINGESGTGKELVAWEIHKNSLREKNAFITINCAAIPDTLLESELFGYEKGAFTGAQSQRIGKFELADKGTLFLDEIGEMSLPLQAKILRIIEKQEFERIGGNKTIKVNVRIITATNKVLEDEVNKGNFREDLYYRIKVYPIFLPPLRERKEDIPILVGHFIKKISEKNNKSVKSITPQSLKYLKEYYWPGNIRELENVIERAILICNGDKLTVEDFPMISGKVAEPEEKITIEKETNDEIFNFNGEIFPIEKIEKKYLEYALKLEKGNISKAAKKLKIGRTTLYRKLQKYNIIKDS